MTELEAALVEIARFLESNGIPYMLIGGLAVAVRGEPRATLDVDISVWAPVECFDEAVGLITSRFRSIPDALAFARRSRVLPIALENGVRADIVFAALEEERALIARAGMVAVEGHEVRVASVEDLIYMKLISERPKDADDARRLLRRFRHTIDRQYLEPKLKAIGEALSRSDILEAFNRELGS